MWAELQIQAGLLPSLLLCTVNTFLETDSVAVMVNPCLYLAFPLGVRKSKQMLSSPS